MELSLLTFIVAKVTRDNQEDDGRYNEMFHGIKEEKLEKKKNYSYYNASVNLVIGVKMISAVDHYL